MWIVYILRCGDNSLYTGITQDIEKRIKSHQKGSGAKYTKGRGPFSLVYSETYPNRSLASQREYALKKLTKEKKQRLFQSKIN